MRKEIILPWTCETRDRFYETKDKIMSIFFPHVILVTGIISLIISFYQLPHYVSGKFNLQLFLFVFYGLVTTTVSLPYLIKWIHDHDLFPTFKCKTKDNKLAREVREK